MNPLSGAVTRPDSFDPTKDYAAVIARGDEWLGDYDVNDITAILRNDLAVIFKTLYVEGAVLFESGGNIGTPIPGVNIGADTAASAGEYIGIESQVYSVKILTGGAAGTATYTWRSTGADNPLYAGQPFSIRAIAPDASTGLGDLATYGHAVGALGVLIVFVNAAGAVAEANSFVIDVTYGARPPVVAGDDITVSDVLIPFQGRIHRVSKTTLSYAHLTSGSSIVFAEWIREVITHVDDPNLTDPLSQEPQGWRERWRVTLQTTDTSALPLGSTQLERRVSPIYRWDRATNVVERVVTNPYAIDINKTQGALDAVRLLNVDQNELLRGLMAILDFGAHGSYIVSPLAPTPRGFLSPLAADSGMIRIGLPPVQARVDGVYVNRRLATDIQIDQATDFGTVTEEPHVYNVASDPFALNKSVGKLVFPIKEILNISATVQIGVEDTGSYESVTRGSGTDDLLAHTPVVAIVRVSDTQGGTADYADPTDYTLVGNSIRWVAGHGPGTGVTYYVVYEYQKSMVENTDFALNPDGTITFAAPLTGDVPVESTVFLVDYTYYLPRYDAIILRANGEFSTLRGLPAEVPITPQIPTNTLAYLNAKVPPNSTSIVFSKFPNDRVTFETINHMRDAIVELANDVAIQDLTNQARVRTTANFLDTLADAFATFLTADLNYNVSAVIFAATIDTLANELTLPFDQTFFSPARVAAPGAEQNVRVGAAWWTLPYTDELAIDSAYWSEAYPVNPYADFTPEPPGIAIKPAQDTFVDTTTQTSTNTRIVENGKHIDFSIVDQFTTVTEQVREIPALFMRRINVKVTGNHFVPEEKLRLKFAGVDVPLTAVSPTTQGSDAFTVIARASTADHVYGSFEGTFQIPAAIPTGTVKVDIWGDGGMVASSWPGDYSLRASANFRSVGIRRIVSVEVTQTLVQNDPIAESITFVDPATGLGVNRMISKVDVPLAAKPADLSPPLLVEIRSTDRSGQASTPIEDTLASVVMEPSDLAVGLTSSNPISMPDPVMVFADEFRSLVLRSASNAYQAFVAILSGPNRAIGGFIEQNAVPGGIFMDSSNNRDWTLRQGWDLRFKCYVAKMSVSEARLYLARASHADMTGFFWNPDQVVPDGTAIQWQYSVDGVALGGGGKVWTDFEPYSLVEFSAVKTDLDIRAILTTEDLYLTPAINITNGTLVVHENQTGTVYVTVAKILTAPATAVNGAVELLTPAGGSQTVYVSVDDGGTWSSVTLGSGTPSSDGFTLYEFTKSGLGAGSVMRGRIEQTTPDASQRPRARRFYIFAEP